LKTPTLDAAPLVERLSWDAGGAANYYGLYPTLLEEETRDAGSHTENDQGWKNRVAMNEKSTFRAQLAEPGPKEPDDFARALPERLTPERSKSMTVGKVPEDAGA